MAGNPPPAVRAELEKQKLPPDRVDYLTPHKVHIGDRPSTIVAFTQLDPVTLGRLVALYEHKVFTQSVVWGINAFDQWGVELGKKLAEQLAPAVRDPSGNPPASQPVSRLLHAMDKMRA
jgi:glucose-6-phosphate isomerase